MAGDWIKMRMDLQTHPKVVRIMSALRADKLRTIGGLHAVWSVFDAHSEDGVLAGYTVEVMDEVIGWQGFSVAMRQVGWLEETPQGLTMPRFDNHNGKSAKRRASDTERKRSERTVRNLSASDADKTVTREEKRREEKIESPIGDSPASVDESADDSKNQEPTAEANTAHQIVLQEFNAVSPVRCSKLTGKRRQALAQRLRDKTWDWRAAIQKIPDSDFLSGRAGNWRGCTIEFFLRPDTVTRIIEGEFDNGAPKAARHGGRAMSDQFDDYVPAKPQTDSEVPF